MKQSSSPQKIFSSGKSQYREFYSELYSDTAIFSSQVAPE